jgi:anionic cell wall polymer biosynthesis LytR-Cps2A-Psr (LCP) family protein
MARRAEQAAQRRRLVRRSLVAVAAVLVVVLVVVAVNALTGGGKKKSTVDAKTRTQRTVLLQVKGSDGSAVASALLAQDDPSASGAVVLLPPQVLVNVPGGGSTSLGKALVTGSPNRSRTALEDLLRVTVDESWVLDGPTFSRLVDAEGGVQATVDVAVVQGRTVVLNPGAARLSGQQALLFMTYLATGEEEQVRLARVQAVLDGVLQALPADVKNLVGSLGAGSVLTGKSDLLVGVLKGLQRDTKDSDVQYRSLPVIKVDAGNDEVRFRLDHDAAQQLVDELLAQSVPAGARTEGNRVLVLNGVGTPGLGESVRAKLVPAGFVYVGSRNADSFNQCCTQVLVKDATAAGGALGARVAAALGVPASSVRSSDQIGTIADVVVIVGKDFRAGK